MAIERAERNKQAATAINCDTPDQLVGGAYHDGHSPRELPRASKDVPLAQPVAGVLFGIRMVSPRAANAQNLQSEQFYSDTGFAGFPKLLERVVNTLTPDTLVRQTRVHIIVVG